MTGCVLWLTEFASPLEAAWVESEARGFSDGERSRLARIGRTLRREQFVVGHVLLRRVLIAHGVADPALAVDPDGRPRLDGAARWHVSLAHCGHTVVALIATAPSGVDIERERSLRDPAGLAALLGDPRADPATALADWVVAEARTKCGFADAPAWITRRDEAWIAVAGVPTPPAVWVHDLANATYNPLAQKWTAVP